MTALQLCKLILSWSHCSSITLSCIIHELNFSSDEQRLCSANCSVGPNLGWDQVSGSLTHWWQQDCRVQNHRQQMKLSKFLLSEGSIVGKIFLDRSWKFPLLIHKHLLANYFELYDRYVFGFGSPVDVLQNVVWIFKRIFSVSALPNKVLIFNLSFSQTKQCYLAKCLSNVHFIDGLNLCNLPKYGWISVICQSLVEFW